MHALKKQKHYLRDKVNHIKEVTNVDPNSNLRVATIKSVKSTHFVDALQSSLNALQTHFGLSQFDLFTN